MTAANEQRPRILIVDDRHEDRMALAHVLDAPDLELVTVGTGSDALRVLLTTDVALILLDARMPGMDGFEVARTIKSRERSRDTPIIFLTAAGADMDVIHDAYDVGAVDYMAKPVDPVVVRAKVAIFVDMFRKDQRIRQQAEALHRAERRQREQELLALRRASEQRYRNLAEAIPQIVWSASVDGAITYLNPRWEEATGMSSEAACGWGWLEAVAPEDRARCAEQWRTLATLGTTQELELRLRSRTGGLRWYLCRAVPDRDPDGGLTGWQGTHTDFDDLKRAQLTAQEAVRLRDDFMAVASHELRSPLATLALHADGLIRSMERDRMDKDATGKRLHAIRRQVERLGRLVDSLLDVSRISLNRVELQLEDVDLSDLVGDVVERMRCDAERAGSRVNLRCTAGVRGRWDRQRLDQVVVNLLGNAIKYGLGKPIDVVVARTDHSAQLTVADQGIGIEPGDQARVFGRFERGVPVQHYGGMGLGLWIARELTHAMGGTISLSSQPRVGTTFTVDLPEAG